ncbi:uncharacterized protein BCR38DRAFT_340947 [Pseudomassariella vexata]|uniref:RNA polymerase II holoenzyme cyclin-like subunit n=1 Tax=Pseudomassariella vexata TaxID=1141098 RepID=A0A1Y2E008_9PEZI|nr:uncharacterized protein BCR38DRAFT_340947 [Pseudomassariella vexata]ORY64861.1 hypothetical protein BCR38DRAFT_340947 [Pseudomassariella vexata]
MAPPTTQASTNGNDPGAATQATVQYPHPGHVASSKQYMTEDIIARLLREDRSSSKEDQYRIDGVTLIENIREAMQLPVKTFDAACTFYHHFRLKHRDVDYHYQDVAIACIFVACKAEDTLKKSKEIICAAYNHKDNVEPRTQDDKMFEQPAKIAIGIERLILETMSFDFRVRNPQKVLVKMVKDVLAGDGTMAFMPLAWDMSFDMYKTFVPLKQTSFTMAFSIVLLTSRISGLAADRIDGLDPEHWHTSRGRVMETVLDLLDLYTQHQKQTRLGEKFDPAKFIDVKIQLNKEMERSGLPRYQKHWCDSCGSDDGATSLLTAASNNSRTSTKHGRDQLSGTNRFVFDAEEAQREREIVAPYFEDEYEEHEIEVEEPIHEPRERPRDHRGHGHGHGHGGQGRRGHGSDGWYGGRGRGRRDRGHRGGFY